MNYLKNDGSLWGIWGSRREWEDAKWMATAKVLQGKLEELLSTEQVSKH
jgi:hypothetical protein